MKGDVAAYRVVYLLQSPLGRVANVTAFGYVTKLLQGLKEVEERHSDNSRG